MNVIAYIRNDFQEKFGIPRQSGVVETALSEIVFEPAYRSAEALRGLPADKWTTLRAVLALDPRPSYQDDPERVYGFAFAGRNVRFRVNGSTLEVLSIDAAGETAS